MVFVDNLEFIIEDIEDIDFGLDVEAKLVYPELEDLEVTPNTEEQVFTHEGSYGYDRVTVKNINLQTKNVTINTNGTHGVLADEGYVGLQQVNVTVDAIEDLNEELTTYNSELERQADIIDSMGDALVNSGIVPAKYAPRYISFYRYSGTELDEELKNLDTSNITDMRYMFGSCQNITTLDLSNFNTSKVTNMSNMFGSCRTQSLNVSHFDTSKVTDMSSMFGGCLNITTLDLSNFNTSEVTNMGSMFADCQKLKNVDLSSFDTSKVTSMGSMFRAAHPLTNLDLSSWDTSNVTSMSQMFYGLSRLTRLDIRNFTFDKVTNNSLMFNNIPVDCEIIVKGDTEKEWVLARRSDFTNVKTVAELEVA